MTPIAYTLLSVAIVSLISFGGVVTLSANVGRLNRMLIYLVSFSAGALFGDVFIHLLPEFFALNGFSLATSLFILAGIVSFFVLEKIIHWHHHHDIEHDDECADRPHPFALVNLVGDGFHNFLDGLIIAASYLLSVPVGIATTIAVVLHEIPQEIGDFGILLHGGFKVRQALLFNFLSALAAVAGGLSAFALAGGPVAIETMLVPFSAGGFIYIAGSDLIPELHKERALDASLLQLAAFIAGIAVMLGLLFVAE